MKWLLACLLADADTEIVNGSTANLRFTALPPELSTLSHLEELHLSRYPILSGGLPEQLALLSRLKVLHLQGSQSLLGTLPSSWSSLTNLTSLWLLEITGLIGTLPDGVQYAMQQNSLLMYCASCFRGHRPITTSDLK